jgi:ATP-binding cassette, subfamily B, bacterial
VQAGSTSAGTVVGAIAVVGMLTGHLRDLGRVAEYAAGAKVASAAARRFLTMPTLADPPGLPDLEIGAGRLEIEELGLAEALEGATLHAEPGQTIAVVGSNGAGKSTLVALAARLLDPDQGSVRLDGQDLRTRNLASVRAEIGIAGPDLPLLRGTVERNVRYRRPRVQPQELARITALCGLDELVDQLPDGWHSEVGDGGERLSAGQRARLAVARAALDNPRLLILDEAEAHLDREAADVVDRVLADHTGTALVVTHRRELVERADVVWCLDAGRVVEIGPPRTLLAGRGPTARLFDTQRPPEPPTERRLVTRGGR